MYITYENGKFAVSGCAHNAAVEILAPIWLDEAGEHAIPLAEDGTGTDACFGVKLTVRQKSDTLFYLHRSLTNVSGEAKQFQTQWLNLLLEKLLWFKMVTGDGAK